MDFEQSKSSYKPVTSVYYSKLDQTRLGIVIYQTFRPLPALYYLCWLLSTFLRWLLSTICFICDSLFSHN